jgi:hypothetical protein
MDWFDLAQDRKAFVNAVMNLRIPYSEEISWLVVGLLDSQEGRCFIKLVS